ncbi:MAG: amino acid adenylation domain protein, partial [Acidobacteria bacterium]|nr:amino acid adenylation domain protein [Acidobacteriota bacterium]
MSTLLEGFDVLEKSEKSASFPASAHQVRLWSDDQAGGYAVPFAVQLRGAVDVEALLRSLDAAVASHEALRTSLRLENGEVVQTIARELHVPLECGDAVAAFECGTSLAVVQKPLLRAQLVRHSETEATLLLTAHPAIVDRPSLRLLADAIVNGAVAPELHYVDFSEWQRTMPESERNKLVDYWQYQLRDIPKTIELPTARPRQAAQTYAPGTTVRLFAPELDAKLTRFCETNGGSRLNILYSAFTALLHRYSGQDDLVLGTSMDVRTDETRGTIGPIANLAALRTRIEVNETPATLLARNEAMLEAAYAYSALPVDRLAQIINPENRAELFDVLFAVEDAPALHAPCGRYDLDVLVHRQDDALVCSIIYNGELHDEWFMAQLARHYERMLAAVIDGDPRQPLADIDLADDAERRLLLHDWATRDAELDGNAVIHGLFEEQVDLNGDRIAVTALGEHVTYGHLDARANRLAHWLLARGVHREQLIAVHIEPSVDTLVAILGILKAGGAYLPLDVNAPVQRIAYQLQDSGCSLLLTTRPADCTELGIDGIIDLNTIRAELAALPATRPEVASSPRDLAYCIYTSGSTGRPKGVLVEHGHVVRLMKNGDFDFDVSERDVWTIFHNFNFDFSVWEMYGALLYGGRAVVVTAEEKHNPETLFELLAREQVTILNQTPSAFYRLLEFAGRAPLALRYVIFGGEGLDPSRLKGWHDAYPETQLVNGYGITETTVFSTMQPCDAQMLASSAGIIGRPMATTVCYVLDDRLRPVPAGVHGQIYVGGLGVSRGYLNRPELTAERFIADPFSPRQGARMYKSGDIARWLPGGRLEFFGRADNQVQLRGYRVELGEIESQLVKRDEVKDAVVIVREDANREQYLAAYVVVEATQSSLATDGRQDGLSSTLRAALKGVLPPYMVPSAFVFLDQLPLTRNGKLNKSALPDPDVQLQQVYVAAETELEKTLALIWQSILKLTDPVSVTADFFGLGGHSLLAMRAVSAMSAALETNIPVKALFEYNTIRELAAYLQGGTTGGYESIPQVDRCEPLPLSFAQQRLWFIDRLEEGSVQYNIPIALRLTGNLDLPALQRSLDQIVERHEVIRSTYHLHGETGVQVVQPARPLSIVRTDLSKVDGAGRETRIEQLLRSESERPFDLTSDLMLRVQLVTLSDREHILLFTMHHIASDGWSMGVLVKELVALYEGFCLGIQTDLAPLPIQYADYAAWQRLRMQGEELERQSSYWKLQLADAPAVHSLPLDHPRPAQQQFAGAFHQTRLGKQVADGLNRLGTESEATLFMVLQTAFSLLLSRWSGVADIVMGTPTAGRNHADAEGLIGFFVNTLVLRSEIAEDAAFTHLLQNARMMVLDAFSNQDIPF